MANAVTLISAIRAGQYDAAFRRLYGAGEAVLARQRQRYCDAIQSFEDIFGKGRELALYSAPGRTEIGGNHTDHNHGIVLAASVDLDIIAVVSKNETPVIRVKSQGFGRVDEVDLARLAPQEEEAGHSAALVRGVAAGVARAGGRVGGFDAYTTSDVLRGSGLSSSAAFEICMGAVLRGEYNGSSAALLTDVKLAQIGQVAENEFFGKPSGLLDQTACSVGGVISIDFKDPAAPVVVRETLDLAAFGHVLCISDTKGSHADLTQDYASVRGEMESVAAALGKPVLREVDEEVFYASLAQLRTRVGDRAIVRAMHFFADSRRAAAMSAAVRQGDFAEFLALVNEAGHSSFEYNQNAYSIRFPHRQGVPVALAVSARVLGRRGAVRLQGGGFAGTIQAFVPNDLAQAYCAAIDGVFGEGSCHVLSIRNVGGTAVTPQLG